jgi:hypothetical protein
LHLPSAAWGVHGQQLHRLDLTERLPSRAHSAASRLCRRCAPRENLGWMVLRLQTAPGRQRPWRTARLLPQSRQSRRPQASSTPGPPTLWPSVR